MNLDQAKKAAAEIGENALAVHVVITDAVSVDSMISTVVEELGSFLYTTHKAQAGHLLGGKTGSQVICCGFGRLGYLI